jgi:hypothetical protein
MDVAGVTVLRRTSSAAKSACVFSSDGGSRRDFGSRDSLFGGVQWRPRRCLGGVWGSSAGRKVVAKFRVAALRVQEEWSACERERVQVRKERSMVIMRLCD